MEKFEYTVATEEEYDNALYRKNKTYTTQELCDRLNELAGKKYYAYSRMVDLGLIFADGVLSVDYGRTGVFDNNEKEYKFIYSRELSDYFKNVIGSIIPEKRLSSKAKKVLESEKTFNEMNATELRSIYGSLIKFYGTKDSEGAPYIVSIFKTYLYKLDGVGVKTFIKNNIDSREIASHTLLTSGLLDRASYYSGRGVMRGDLNENNLITIFKKLYKLDKAYADEFIKLVKEMPTLGATEFITSFLKFGANGFKVEDQTIEKSNVSLDGVYDKARDAVALVSLFSVMRRGNDHDEQVRESNYIRDAFMNKVRFVDKSYWDAAAKAEEKESQGKRYIYFDSPRR